MEHATLQPSSAARWVQCPGSVVMEAMFPQADTDSSVEGTLAHEVVAARLLGKPIPAGATEEMLDGADTFEDYVLGIKKQVNPHVTAVVECRVNCFDIHPECWGTPDVRVTDVALGKIFIPDYKFGHRYVDPFENWQLLCYAIGAVANYGTATTDDLEITLAVVQPRSYHKEGPIREWVIKASDLEPYLAVLKGSAAEAMSGNAATHTGPECRDCKARHACPAYQDAAYMAVEMSGEPTPFDLPATAIGHELALLQSAADVLKGRISGLEMEMMATLKRGERVNGWMLEQGMGREKFSVPVVEILALGEMMGVDLSKPGVVTPKQAIKAGIPAAVIAGYTETPFGEIKLVRDTGIRKVFSS